jgi:hypothetical protein
MRHKIPESTYWGMSGNRAEKLQINPLRRYPHHFFDSGQTGRDFFGTA